mmetsp:Transcript_1450/g.1987  ORF Transcript_1450/g.1987 Transcript_1450/m.1987 type:complete len:227 (-) Transcript_1450:106-786(-)|eukprot:CAMPEP_0198144890 /NCGR_PEP_ID=MMETSP1443-20131203/19377_1 /TAXON_ID=186043 /ORGANISM="Entomoneis sp., Strain CCMP2396" /LENGTH=226 /DNA_ID=CAMNT_0043808379 /DNA_START=90 /DNA_END=770 /DNA_ORIENTATION=-
MGVVFGKQTVAEPAFDLVYKHSANLSYEIRRYNTRFAAEVVYTSTPGEEADNTPFSILAKYIGVFGKPENESQEAMSMTAPVVKTHGGKPIKISMTAPVVKQEGEGGKQIMAFMLPAEYDSLSKIPKPTNPKVQIKEIPPQAGVVHRYSGSYSDDQSNEMAQDLAEQLRKDGLEKMTNEFVLEHYEFWGYNPPFTLPMFRRNEIWIGLSEEEVDKLVNGVGGNKLN